MFKKMILFKRDLYPYSQKTYYLLLYLYYKDSFKIYEQR